MKGKSIISVVVAYRPNSLEGLLQAISSRTNILIDNSKNNIGYAAGANKGIRMAMEKDARWIIVLNQDVKCSKESFKEFVEKLKKTPPGIAGPFAGSFDPKRWTTMLPASPRLQRGESARGSVDYISGSFIAIHRAVIRKIGFFYEPYFMYYEDADICVRATRTGFPLVHIPLDIVHKDNSNEYYLARNHLLFVERNAPMNVKVREFLRLLKTFYEHRGKGNEGGEQGVRDYMLRRFGRRDI